MKRWALRLTGMFIGRHALTGMFTVTDCCCRTEELRRSAAKEARLGLVPGRCFQLGADRLEVIEPLELAVVR